MKELSINEKAKAYDEAIERAKKMYGNEIAEEIFPELKESQDEKIRKWIIDDIRYNMNNEPLNNSEYKKKAEKAIAWLEKQEEQKKQVHFPKFTFDDVLALQCCMETVKKVQEDKELYEKLNLIHSKMYDAYWLGKQGETSPILSNSSNTVKNEQKSADKIEQRFDPKTLIAFDKVLVRLRKDCIWHATFFSHYDKEVKWGCYPFVTTGSRSYSECIPYNEYTKHLLGTTEEAPEYYRYWED